MISRLGLPFERSESREMLTMLGWIALIHFLVEALVMGMLSGWDFSSHVVAEGLLDATLLTVFSSPLIYFWVAKPFIHSARTAEAALAQEINVKAEQAGELKTALDSLKQTLHQNELLRDRLEQANLKIADVNERTLQRVGADLHDGPSQLLTYSLMRLGKFAPIIEASGGKRGLEELELMRSALNDTFTEIRNLSRGLSLPQLASASLQDVVMMAVGMHQEQTGSIVQVITRDLPVAAQLPLKICIYRVVQESLANAYKHARSVSLTVNCYMDEDLILVISDAGVGFDPEQETGEGLGLNGMRARVEALGGTLRIESQVGRGTKLTARFSIETSNQHQAAHV
jgi:signal transduction histidine kinase